MPYVQIAHTPKNKSRTLCQMAITAIVLAAIMFCIVQYERVVDKTMSMSYTKQNWPVFTMFAAGKHSTTMAKAVHVGKG